MREEISTWKLSLTEGIPVGLSDQLGKAGGGKPSFPTSNYVESNPAMLGRGFQKSTLVPRGWEGGLAPARSQPGSLFPTMNLPLPFQRLLNRLLRKRRHYLITLLIRMQAVVAQFVFQESLIVTHR